MGEYPHCGSCQQNNRTFSGHDRCVCTHAHMHSWDLPEGVYLCANVCEICLHRHGVIVLLSTVLWMSVCRGLSVRVQMYPLAYISVHPYLSVCIRVTSCLLPDTAWTQLPAVLPELCPIPTS